MAGIITASLKVSNFSDKIIKNGQKAHRRALFGMGKAARNELRNTLIRRKKKKFDPKKPDRYLGSRPNQAPYSRKSDPYSKSAVFEVNVKSSSLKAGFGVRTNKVIRTRNGTRKTIKSGLAQDVLEGGGKVKFLVKNSQGSFTISRQVQPRPHVSIAEDRLFTGATKNARFFLKQQQFLIDRGYLR